MIATPILRPSSASISATQILPVTTPPSTSTNTPNFMTPPSQARVKTASTCTTDVSVNTETQDSQVAKTILEMPKSLLEALE